jgi:uncharacterized protein (DUF2249 family)
MSAKVVTLDVRAALAQGQAPCGNIQETAAGLQPGESLCLLTPFEPVPLYEVLGSQGFAHASKPLGAGDWETLFTRNSMPASGEAKSAPSAGCGCGCAAHEAAAVVEVDARQLEPPQPMVKILEALAALPDGVELRARTDRRPVHLYPMLEARGFVGESTEQSDGSFLTQIRRS